MPKDSKNIRKMADLLKQGATLTKYACPACSSPLFKPINGELWCVSCQKKVIIQKEGEPKEYDIPIFSNLESTIKNKIQKLGKELQEENDPKKIQILGTTLTNLLENLEKIRKMKKSS